MDRNLIRLGRISTIDYAKGRARIVYTERQKAVSAEMPFFCAEYFMPEIDDLVAVMHCSSGVEFAVILGRFWTDKNVPVEGFSGLFRKELARIQGECYLRYDSNTGLLRLFDTKGDAEIKAKAADITASDREIDITAKTDINLTAQGDITASADVNITLQGDEVTIDGTDIILKTASEDTSVQAILDRITALEALHEETV